jgi:hypothetical protein
MSILLDYKDSVEIVKTKVDNYGGQRIDEIETVSCLFISKNSSSHAQNQDSIDSDAELYIDPTSAFVIENFYRLEEMLVIAGRFNTSDSDSWYKITSVSVGEDKLLDNEINNILLRLKKTVGITYVS